MSQRYKDLLRMLRPLDLGGYAETRDAVAAETLEDMHGLCDALLLEVHPETATHTLVEWARRFGLTGQESLSLEQRRQNATAAMVARGLSNPPAIKTALKPYLGYEPKIEQYPPFFSEDELSLTSDGDGPDYALDPAYVYMFSVLVDRDRITSGGFDPLAMQNIIDRMKQSHTQGLLDTGGDGFYSEESLTELDLTSDG